MVEFGDRLRTPGTRFMVIDAGGGTIDITSYRVERGGRLGQLATANGDKAGSEYLNRFFVEDILCQRFGLPFVQKLSEQHPYVLYELVKAWESTKRHVKRGDSGPENITLTVPIYELATADGTALKKLKECQAGIAQAILIDRSEIDALFGRVIEIIEKDIEAQLNEMRRVAGRSGDELALLVGGFAESPFLQASLREFLQRRGVELLIPPAPSVAVVRGAAHFAYEPDLFVFRRAPLTYGIACSSPFRRGVDPDSKKKIDEDGVEKCVGRFSVSVTNGDQVEVGSFRPSSFTPWSSQDRHVRIVLCATRDRDPQYVDDPGVDEIASIDVDVSGAMHLPRDERSVDVKMYFGDTRIRVEAENKETGRPVSTEVRWKASW